MVCTAASEDSSTLPADRVGPQKRVGEEGTAGGGRAGTAVRHRPEPGVEVNGKVWERQLPKDPGNSIKIRGNGGCKEEGSGTSLTEPQRLIPS